MLIEHKTHDIDRRGGIPSHPRSLDQCPGISLFFLIDCHLVPDIKIRLVAIGLGQTFGRQLRVHRLFDFRVHDLVRMRTALGILAPPVVHWELSGLPASTDCSGLRSHAAPNQFPIASPLFPGVEGAFWTEPQK